MTEPKFKAQKIKKTSQNSAINELIPETDEAELSGHAHEAEASPDLQRLSIDPKKPFVMTSSNIRSLQQTLGNNKVARLLADQRNHPKVQTIQRHGDHDHGEEEETPVSRTILRQTDKETSGSETLKSMAPIQIQRHPTGTDLKAKPSVASANLQSAQAQAKSGVLSEQKGDKKSKKKKVTTPDLTVTIPTTPTTVPVPVLPSTLDQAYAQQLITTHYGVVAGKPIVMGNIITVEDQAGIDDAYDTAAMGLGMTVEGDDGNQRPWEKGDHNKQNPGVSLNGFTDGTTVWVNKATGDPTTMVHEMLHVNAFSDFKSRTNELIDEGVTQILAEEAVTADGRSIAGSEGTYPEQKLVVAKLIAVVGKDLVLKSYFKGASTLINTYDALMGEDSFAAMIDQLNQGKLDDVKNGLVPRTKPQKILLVKNKVKDGFFVNEASIKLLLEHKPGDAAEIKADPGINAELARIATKIITGSLKTSDKDLDKIEAMFSSPVVDKVILRPLLTPLIKKLNFKAKSKRLTTILA